MLRFLVLAVIIAMPLAAAPVPKSPTNEERIRKLFGKVVYPNKDCKLLHRNKTVVAKLPKEQTGSPDDLFKSIHSQQEASGDFELTVTISTSLPNSPPQAEKNVQIDHEYACGGGLYVMDHRNQILLSLSCWFERAENKRNGEFFWEKWIGLKYPGGGSGSGERGSDPTSAKNARLSLRIVRVDDTLVALTSLDGDEWSRWESLKIEKLGRDLIVGLYAFNRYEQPADVTFEDFKLVLRN